MTLSEILRQAVGTFRAHKMRTLLTMWGIVWGILGLSFGRGAWIAREALPLPDFVRHPIVSPISIMVSILTLSRITVTAGMYLAQRAAEMTPLESLRYE
jgi:putative ABC transport system permease protein